jgi:urease accessory protein
MPLSTALQTYTMNSTEEEISRLQSEISRLQAELAQLHPPSVSPHPNVSTSSSALSSLPSLHALLLLSDSALPLSAFAFSSGLESYLAHHTHAPSLPHQPSSRPSTLPSKLSLFLPFLTQSLSSLTRTSLPFVLAAYDAPARLAEWDDTCDASMLCNVGRRQSIEQGRALIAVWMRGLSRLGGAGREPEELARTALLQLDTALKRPSGHAPQPELAHGHLAPLFGVVARVAGVRRLDAAYVFLLNHTKSLVSAAVRAGVCGPFKQQELLAGQEVRRLVAMGVEEGERVYRERGIEGVGQTVGLLDIWQGRHEILYSRVFNS